MTVTVSRFEEDVKWLKAHGYASVLPRELAAGDPAAPEGRDDHL